MRERADHIHSLGAEVIGIGTREDFQARALLADGMPFPLLLDPDDTVRRELGIAERFRLRTLLHPKGAVAYAKALRRARFFDAVWAEATQRPATVVLDRELRITWAHLGERLGDYPHVEDALAALEEAAGR